MSASAWLSDDDQLSWVKQRLIADSKEWLILQLLAAAPVVGVVEEKA
jgi:hypothetical protein